MIVSAIRVTLLKAVEAEPDVVAILVIVVSIRLVDAVKG